ncbi:hypothetical protein AMECASPLE_036901, partial [Ameca splendens]
EKYYNRTVRDLDCLKAGDSVRVQPFNPCKTWEAATVLRPVSSRSYEVEMESGGVLRKNRRHLRHNHNTPTLPPHTGTSTKAETVPVLVTPEHGGIITVTTRSGRQVKTPAYLNDYCK